MQRYITASFVLASLVSTSLQAATQDILCRVASVNEANNPWEEGLGIFGSPNTDSDSQEVHIKLKDGKPVRISVGQPSWTAGRNATLTTESLADRTLYKATDSAGEELVIGIFSETQRGYVLFKESSADALQKTATFDCSSTDVVLNSNPGETNVQKLTKSQMNALPEAVKQHMAEIDFVDGLNDRGYRLELLNTYKVTNRDGSLAGFIAVGHLSHVDSDDVEALVVYDRNGLRLYGPEIVSGDDE